MHNQFFKFWNHIPEHINPVIVQIGQFQVRYYGLMYVIAFSALYILVMYRVKNETYEYSKNVIQNFFVWAILGLMVGARLGYVVFYNLKYYSAHPLEIILPFSFVNGFHYTGITGMSYHGGLIGVLLASIFFCYKNKINFWHLSDLFIPAIPLGYTFGRIGNFINGELYGRITSTRWGMYFPSDPTGQLRHPSQLYEAFFEGVFLFFILWNVRKKRPFNGFFLSLYLIGYGLVRFFIEFIRQPDPHLGFILGPLTTGQILCLTMIAGGVVIIFIRKKSRYSQINQQ
ncbi:MAG: prolipoprotein diacylglyceryl transferase [Thermodesulfovibrionia bacterium]|nr:prolipoprotein diacylglyceryl transferase [Thermodesulfovibrionia bacterium]